MLTGIPVFFSKWAAPSEHMFRGPFHFILNLASVSQRKDSGVKSVRVPLPVIVIVIVILILGPYITSKKSKVSSQKLRLRLS
jgi:hypothetical protein